MDQALPACLTHRDLVDAAGGPDPTDDVLQRYATEVGSCPDCRRALAVQLQVHPAVLSQGGTQPLPFLRRQGLEALWDVVQQPVPAQRWRLAQGVVALAVAAGVAWALWPAVQAPVPAPPLPAPEVVHAPALPPPLVPDAVAESSPPPSAPTAPAQDNDAVALVEQVEPNVADWPAPPFEELRAGTAKAVGGLMAVQLVLSGSGPMAVGDRVGLTAVASDATALSVCVSGPEQGMIWRGGVPGGRVDLTRDGRLQSFVFGAPGRYRFAVSTTDMEACTTPVHVVEVMVGG